MSFRDARLLNPAVIALNEHLTVSGGEELVVQGGELEHEARSGPEATEGGEVEGAQLPAGQGVEP